jgi:hypothetical protein
MSKIDEIRDELYIAVEGEDIRDSILAALDLAKEYAEGMIECEKDKELEEEMTAASDGKVLEGPIITVNVPVGGASADNGGRTGMPRCQVSVIVNIITPP